MSQALAERYGPDDLEVFDEEERRRFLPPFGAAESWPTLAPFVAWELLYRKEPELYERVIAGERIHPQVLAHLESVDRCVELAAGTGRLTADLATRCGSIVAFEPVASFRATLIAKGFDNVEVRKGFFDAIDVSSDWADLTVSCSAFTADPRHGGERGLAEMERVTRPGGTIALVWPSDVDWLVEHGFAYESFEGEMSVEFSSVEEAVELARIFYPDAVDEIIRGGSRFVAYDVLGLNAPRDIAWKVLE
ncbi:MAG: class I SAM-dependent methyltransferase [Actinomycetota bacterium]